MRLPILLALAVLLAACGGGDDPAAEVPTTGTEADGAATAPAPDDPATGTLDAVMLEADGLQAQEALAFDDAEQGAVIAAVGSALERGPTSNESQLECGPGQLDAVSWDGLDLYFLDGTLAGWYLAQPQPAGVQTTGDVQLDTTTLADLRSAFSDLTVEESTIGIEWLGGGLSGTLSNDSDSGTVDVVWAGATCIAR